MPVQARKSQAINIPKKLLFIIITKVIEALKLANAYIMWIANQLITRHLCYMSHLQLYRTIE